MEENFNQIIKTLSSALIDDFRGFINSDGQRIEVPDNKYHLSIALREMSKLPNWNYQSGVGQNVFIDYLNRRTIYITKLPTENGLFQRTVGYLTDAYSNNTIYRGHELKEYEVLRKIAIGMGYDVDEYTFQKNTNNTLTPPVSVTNYKGNLIVNRNKNIKLNVLKHVSEGDKPIFDDKQNLLGFMVNGKFVSKNHYERYSNINNKTSDDELIH